MKTMSLAKYRRLIVKGEWWELWCVIPGQLPCFIRAYGQPTRSWLPDGVHPTRKSAFEDRRARANRYDKVIHVRRYATRKSP
jgi:hypothetical protein